MKEVRFSEHAELKIKVLSNHGIVVTKDLILEVIRSPEGLEDGEDGKRIAQRGLDKSRVLRVVYREFDAFILIITLYPGRRSRYEKN